jgi:hypothetical protein
MTARGPRYYILSHRKALPVRDVIKWATWFETADRQVALTEFLNIEPWVSLDRARIKERIEARRRLGMVPPTRDDIRMLGRMIVISTTFMGLDHSFGAGPPLLFETMIFNGPCDGEQSRYPDWTTAEAGHREAVARVRRALDADPRIGDGVSRPHDW